MKISQKRICGDCWALTLNPPCCEIGFKIHTGIEGFKRVGVIKPLEPCPKPLTRHDYVEAITNFPRHFRANND